jgi:hypothetical protein
MPTGSIAGLHAWEMPTWLPSGDDLPDWLAALRERHVAAVSEYHAAIAGVVDAAGRVDGDARAWRRSVRDALAAGKPPPEREQGAVQRARDREARATER